MLTLRTIKGLPLTYQEVDDNFTHLEALSTGATLTNILANGNATSGQSMTITNGDTLDINGTIDFTNSTIVGLNTAPETLAQTLAAGNSTNGNDIVVSNGDHLNIVGGLTESYTNFKEDGELNPNKIGQHIDAGASNVAMVNYTGPDDGKILKIVRVDDNPNTNLEIVATDVSFAYNGSVVNSFTLSVYDSVTFIYNRTYDLWFEQK